MNWKHQYIIGLLNAVFNNDLHNTLLQQNKSRVYHEALCFNEADFITLYFLKQFKHWKE